MVLLLPWYFYSILQSSEIQEWIDKSLADAKIENGEVCSLIRDCLKFNPQERLRKEALLDHAFFREVIPVVGTTGTGKSTLISLMTGQHLESGSGPISVTKDCQMVEGGPATVSVFFVFCLRTLPCRIVPPGLLLGRVFKKALL